MPTGHIALDGREYMLADTDAYRQLLGSQMALRASHGDSEFGSSDGWSDLVWSDFAAGVGIRDERSGGCRYAEADVRFPGVWSAQPLVLPVGTFASHVPVNQDALRMRVESGALRFMRVGPTESVRFIRLKPSTGFIGQPYNNYWFYGIPLTTGNVKTQLRVTRNPLSGSEYHQSGETTFSFTVNGVERLPYYIPRQFRAHFSSYNTSVPSSYWSDEHWVDIRFTAGSVLLPIVDKEAVEATPGAVGSMYTYNGSTWSEYTGGVPLWGLVRTNTDYEVAWGGVFSDAVGKWLIGKDGSLQRDANGLWAVRRSFPAVCRPAAWSNLVRTSIAVWSGTLLVCHRNNVLCNGLAGPGYDPQMVAYYDAVADAWVSTNWKADLIAAHSGYFWRVRQNLVSYSTSPALSHVGSPLALYAGELAELEVGPPEFPVEAIVPFQEDVMCVRADGLYAITPGDRVVGVTQWPVRLPGKIIAREWQGVLYVAMGKHLFRYTPDGRMVDISPMMRPNLPGFMQGEVTALNSTEHMLLAGVHDTASGVTTIMGWDGNSWHVLTSLLAASHSDKTTLLVDRSEGEIFCSAIMAWRFKTDLTSFNAAQSDTPRGLFAPMSWVETDWIYGSKRDVLKDWESVAVIWERSRLDKPVELEIYYRRPEHGTGAAGWIYLGKATAANGEIQEIRFTGTHRVPSRAIRLGFRMINDFVTPPLVYAIRLKYQAMLNDTWRWTMPILISGNSTTPQQMMEGVNGYNRVQQRQHLEQLAKKATPIVFRDLNGGTYNVKVAEMGFVPTRVEYVNGQVEADGIVQLTLEEQGGTVSV